METYANNVHGTLGANVGTGDTTITLGSGQGASFSSPIAGDFYRLTLIRADLSVREIVYVTARSGDVLTVTRAQEGTTASTFSTGDRVRQRPTAGMLQALEAQLAFEDLYSYHAGGFSNALAEWGVSINESGTTSTPVPSGASHRASQYRRVNTTINTSTAAGFNQTVFSRVWRGNAANTGGFDVEFDFGIEAHPSTMSMFVGITSTTNHLLSSFNQPSAATTSHLIGVGFDLSSAGAEYNVFRNDGSGTPTATATGIISNTTDWLRLRLFADPNASGINLTFTNLTTRVVWSATNVSTDIPANTQFLLPQGVVRNTVSAGGAIAFLGCRQRRIPA